MAKHADLTSIHRAAYHQDTDPGAVGGDKWWFQPSTGLLMRRASDNSGWLLLLDTTATVTVHESAPDPHPQYQKESEKDTPGGYAGLDASGKLAASVLPDSLATDSELAAAITTHEAATDPHPQYASDSDVTAAVAAHEAAADPHAGYQKESEKGAPNGYAGLDASGLVPPAQLGAGTADNTTFLRGDGQWAAPPSGGGGMADPMTTAGDLIYRDASNTTARLPVGTLGQTLRVRGATPVPTWEDTYAGLQVLLDGGGQALTTGVKLDLVLPFDCEITEWTLLADQAGDLVIDLWRSTYAAFPPTSAGSITGSAKPTLSSANKAQSSTLTGWTTQLAAGDVLRVNIDSAATVTRATLALRVRRT